MSCMGSPACVGVLRLAGQAPLEKQRQQRLDGSAVLATEGHCLLAPWLPGPRLTDEETASGTGLGHTAGKCSCCPSGNTEPSGWAWPVSQDRVLCSSQAAAGQLGPVPPLPVLRRPSCGGRMCPPGRVEATPHHCHVPLAICGLCHACGGLSERHRQGLAASSFLAQPLNCPGSGPCGPEQGNRSSAFLPQLPSVLCVSWGLTCPRSWSRETNVQGSLFRLLCFSQVPLSSSWGLLTAPTL